MLTLEQKQELVDACPDRILELDEPTGNLQAVENAYEMATFTEDLKVAQEAMKKRPEDEDFVNAVQSTDRFTFSVESTGAMDAEDIFLPASAQGSTCQMVSRSSSYISILAHYYNK